MTNPLPFTSSTATLENAGGKGANLARLTRLGFPVPAGFILPTSAYRAFVSANGLGERIRASLDGLAPEDTLALENASQDIRTAFQAGVMDEKIRSAILEAYKVLQFGGESFHPVAVRSSATAEDLPDLSFAGQQDTYLNVQGEAQLLRAVVGCWSSLWTARAIGYRLRNRIPHDDAALAVVVQEMVPSEVSGVLFSANPLTGLLSEAVIDATFGLGEALVSGQVEPDHFVVNLLSGEVVSKTLGAKRVSTRSRAGGGVESVQENAGTRQTLSDEQIRQLASLGQKVQQEYGAPQDIEWAYTQGKLYLLQARAITSLFPVPQVSFDPLLIWISFGAVQGLMGPITPLGRDAIQHLALGASRMFGITVRFEDIDVFRTAGERIWVKLSDVLRHPLGYRLFDGLIGFIEPSVGQIVRPLLTDPRLGAGKGKFKFSTMGRIAYFARSILPRLVRNMLRPEGARAVFEADIEDYLRTAQIAPATDRFEGLANVIAFMKDRIANAFPFLLPRFIAIFGPSMASLNLLNDLAGEKLALEVTRGLPNNVTTQMDLALWQTASVLRADAASREAFLSADGKALAARFLKNDLPPVAQRAIAGFLQDYGMRGVGEVDFGQPRWRENPAPVMHTLQSYLEINPQYAPDVLFAKGEEAAQEAIEKIAAIARQGGVGWLKEKMARGAARRIRLLMGARESPKFFAVRTMGIARRALLEVGAEFVAAGTIEYNDDLVFLNLAELEALSRDEACDWKSLIAGRRAIYERELHRRQVPRVLVSDGRAFYEGVGAQTDTGDVIRGSAVSPGVVEGIVHVVLDPRSTQLTPGEILVCPGTDPAWTPLFLAAGGLITEVGGMMTHGSVVAREYGIPAVVGVHQATLRLKDGQRIRVDGTQGYIWIL